jgi:L-threonylcarbamoyladenylate synthase
VPPPVLRLDAGRPDAAAVRRAVDTLAAGGLLILPTETVYGLAADPRVPGAADRLFEAKGRSKEKPVAFLADDLSRVRAFGAILSPAAEALARAHWPGPLTLVLPCGGGVEGFRVPDHGGALAVLRAAGHVLAVTSANRSGEPPARDCAAAVAAVGDHAALALDAGPSTGGEASTVVRVDGANWEILREGPLTRAALVRLLGLPR